MIVTILYSENRTDTANDLLNKLEIEFIDRYNILVPNGYNLKSGGNQPVLSEVTKLRMSISGKKKKLSDEHKKKLFIAQNKSWVKEKKSFTHSRKILQFSIDGVFIKEWSSITEASKSCGINMTAIKQSCRKGCNSHGYKWRYKDE